MFCPLHMVVDPLIDPFGSPLEIDFSPLDINDKRINRKEIKPNLTLMQFRRQTVNKSGMFPQIYVNNLLSPK